MRAAMHTKVRAANNGKVTFAGYMGGGGNVVMIMGDDGIQTRYLHLTKAGVSVGQSVSAGEIIALSGNTGHASAAPHLHFETRPGGSQVVDPRGLLCSSLAEKPGAGPDRSADGQLPPGSGAPPQQAEFGPSFATTSLNAYDGMSEMEMLRMETERRFLNPDWHTQLGGCGRDINQSEIDGKPHEGIDCEVYLRREMNEMQVLSNYINSKKRDALERITAIMANRNIDQAKGVDEQKLQNLANRARQMNAPKLK